MIWTRFLLSKITHLIPTSYKNTFTISTIGLGLSLTSYDHPKITSTLHDYFTSNLSDNISCNNLTYSLIQNIKNNFKRRIDITYDSERIKDKIGLWLSDTSLRLTLGTSLCQYHVKLIIDWHIDKINELQDESVVVINNKNYFIESMIKLINNQSLNHHILILNYPGIIPKLIELSNKYPNLKLALEKSFRENDQILNIDNEDLHQILKIIQGESGIDKKILCIKFLEAYVKSSVSNTQNLITNHESNLFLQSISTYFNNSSTEFQLAIIMFLKKLIENCTSRNMLCMDMWINPILCAMVDVITKDSTDFELLLAYKDLLICCIHSFTNKVGHVIGDSNIWSLLKLLFIKENQDFNLISIHLLQSILTSVNIKIPEEEYEYWCRKLLKWINNEKREIEEEEKEISKKLLYDMIMKNKDINMAKEWFSEILIEISNKNEENIKLQIKPSYMRYVAAEIKGIEEEYIPYVEYYYHSPIENYSEIKTCDNNISSLSIGMKMICDMLEYENISKEWLYKKGILECFLILMELDENLNLKEKQEISRLLSMMTISDIPLIAFEPYIKILSEWQYASDLFLASNAVKSLIHIQNQIKNHTIYYPDGVHLFNVNTAISKIKSGFNYEDDCVVDIVFVHGMRGGPFVTWRKASSNKSMDQLTECWPSDWLANDIPNARIISIEYAAPFTQWEGNAFCLKEVSRMIYEKLKMAGIGKERPVIFVTHSMGGIIIKEILSSCLISCSTKENTFLNKTKGIIFYTVPHSGTKLANLAWTLRHVGLSPAPTLKFMTTGPYLKKLNEIVNQWYNDHDVEILNYIECEPTELSRIIPKIKIVTRDSGNPGYGELIELMNTDHIKACKPENRKDMAYERTLKFIRNIIIDG